MIILVILAAAAFFCYSIVRLCLLVFQPERNRRGRSRPSHHMFGPGGYVVPPKPIPVVLARDEEAAGVEGGAAKLEPPAYGLWRESVVSEPAESED